MGRKRRLRIVSPVAKKFCIEALALAGMLDA